MLRNSGLGGMRRTRRAEREVDPMSGLANLADVMLVFACGLLTAVVLFWRVDLANVTVPVDRSDLEELGDVERALESGLLDAGMESKGVVYEDPETGRMYIIMPADAGQEGEKP